jgi:hypothetical protein
MHIKIPGRNLRARVIRQSRERAAGDDDRSRQEKNQFTGLQRRSGGNVFLTTLITSMTREACASEGDQRPTAAMAWAGVARGESRKTAPAVASVTGAICTQTSRSLR